MELIMTVASITSSTQITDGTVTLAKLAGDAKAWALLWGNK